MLNFISNLTLFKLSIMSFELPELPYSNDALEPHIDAKTMEIHHGKHHAGYTNNLNSALQGTSMEGLPIEEVPVSYTHLTLPTICSV